MPRRTDDQHVEIAIVAAGRRGRQSRQLRPGRPVVGGLEDEDLFGRREPTPLEFLGYETPQMSRIGGVDRALAAGADGLPPAVSPPGRPPAAQSDPAPGRT